MFDVGFWELLLISIIALVVVGPDKIPEFAKSVGTFVGKVKSFVANAKEDVQQEFAVDDLKEQLGFKKNESIVDIVKDSKNQIQEHFNSNPNNAKESKQTPQQSTTQTKKK